MVHLAMLLLLAPVENRIPQVLIRRQDAHTATAVTDKFLVPTRPPDCKTEAEVRRAVEQVRKGGPGECWVRDISAFNRHGG
jgi:hypothetical protein